MVRKILALTTVMFVFGILASATIQAALVGFRFDANDFIQKYGTDFTGGLKLTQDNPRRLHKTWGNESYDTFSNYLKAGMTQSESGNTYANWTAGLGTGEGITAFNFWLRGNSTARTWGETLVTDPDSIYKPVGYAPSGWNAYTKANPSGGWLVYWWTSDLEYAINSISTLGMFGFDADVYVDKNKNGYYPGDPDAVKGDSYRIWFGSYWGAQPGDDPDNWNPFEHSLAFDKLGWGSLSGYDAFQPGPVGSDVGWEGVLTLEAGDPVPEPGTLLLLGSGLVGLAGYGKIRIRRKKK